MRELETKENWKVRNNTRDWTWDLLISTYLYCIINSWNSTAKCTPRTKQKANNWQDNRKDEAMIFWISVLHINCFRGLDCNDSRISLHLQVYITTIITHILTAWSWVISIPVYQKKKQNVVLEMHVLLLLTWYWGFMYKCHELLLLYQFYWYLPE